jgi:hypothetical protein
MANTTAQGEVRLFQTRITLSDPSAPVVRSASGLVAASTVSGAIRVEIDVEDRGSGVAEVATVVDGVPQPATRVANRTCSIPYVDVLPCPLKQVLVGTFDSSATTEGSHEVRFAVRDAAGNETRTDPVVVTVVRPVAPVAPSALPPAKLRAWFSGRNRSIARTVRYGGRATVEGTLADLAGAPLPGGAVSVVERTTGTGGRVTRRAQVTTDAAGHFIYRLLRGPSRAIEVLYGASTARVTVKVRAGVSLKTSRTSVRNGTTLRFNGRIRGEAGQRRAALVTIYALTSGPRRRIPVETLRATASGRFSYTYRFARIPGRVDYRFEARVPEQMGFPYLEGASPAVVVRARP